MTTSACVVATKLRQSSAVAARRVIVSASWPTISAPLQRRAPMDPVPPLPPSFRATRTSVLDSCSAGTSPNANVENSAIAPTKK